MDIFTASRFAILFKMSSSLIPVASPSWCEHGCPLTREPLSPGPRAQHQQTKLISFHIFVVVIQGKECYLYCKGFQLLPGSARLASALCVRPSGADAPPWTGGHPWTMETSIDWWTNTCPPWGMLSPRPYNPPVSAAMVFTSALKSLDNQGFTSGRPFHHLM